jgi:hypothetical protein
MPIIASGGLVCSAAHNVSPARGSWPLDLAAARAQSEYAGGRSRRAVLEESLDNTCEQCDGACPHRKDGGL